MIYKPYREIEEMIRRNYLAVDERHATHPDDNRLELGAGDWANPIEIGGVDDIEARQLVKLPADGYVFTYAFDEGLGYFVVNLGSQLVSVKRITREEALELEANG